MADAVKNEPTMQPAMRGKVAAALPAVLGPVCSDGSRDDPRPPTTVLTILAPCSFFPGRLFSLLPNA